MKLEKLKKKNYQKVIIGGLITLSILSVLIYKTTSAKYRTTQSINIAKGTINYSPADFKILAMYQANNSGTYTEIDKMPASGYAINESKSYCTLDGTNKDTNAILKTIDGNHTFANLSKNSKCYLYFDVKPITNVTELIASLNSKETAPNYAQAATGDDGVYKIADGMYGGYSYVFRGAISNNWVKFANMYWRIIRINGDGTIRLIYTGDTSLSNVRVDADGVIATGNGTQLSNDNGTALYCAYNSSYNRSEYVGYTYTIGSQRTIGGTNSTIKGIVDNWYITNIGNKTTYSLKVADGKYCNDRNVASGSTWDSQPSSEIYYAAWERLINAKTPTLSCNNVGDVYTLKAGLITADEVSIAGGLFETINSNYYLYTNQAYFTMSPSYYDSSGSSAIVFYASSDGRLWNGSYVSWTAGVRPVINLKANTQFQTGGTGTFSNPYVVI